MDFDLTVCNITYAGNSEKIFKDAEMLKSGRPGDLDDLIEYAKECGGIPDSCRQTEGRITVQ